ncbi:MAG: O-succinylhomoserine sulfhydrylase [Alphaproteobacteria bacterium]|nr:O-succinylhomoserine sulfhydrylase [Alphaproteobacteria bacterium]
MTQKKSDPRSWNMSTQLVRAGTLRSNFGETSEAIFLNSGYCYESAEIAESRFNGSAPGFAYSRYSNPSLSMLETRLAVLEGADKALVMASGMAAVYASIMCQLKAGDHIIANKVLFSSCYYIITNVLPRLGFEVTLVDGPNLDEWRKAFRPNTRCVFIETPANPTLELVDIAAVAEMSKKNGSCLILDNVFATPLLQRPLELGADVVVYSTTKHLEGQGRTLGGAVIGNEPFMSEILLPYHRHTGPHMSPFTAWVVLKGLETLDLRMARHCDNAQALAELLESHPQVTKVLFPGLPSFPQYELAQRQMKRGGCLIAFEVKGGKAGAFAFMNKLKIIDISNNLGDAKSLITHPASTTHSSVPKAIKDACGVTENLIRFSVGIEDIDDLKGDILQALA